MPQSTNSSPRKLAGAWRKHERRWKGNRYVYAVVSRRSRGVSIGINLNPGKECNFDCVYCQVDRGLPPQVRKVDLQALSAELELILEAEKDGTLYLDDPFDVLADVERGVRDIAFSGDGEPTTFPRFENAVRIAAEARSRFELNSTRLVLITDAAYLHKPPVRAALDILDQNNGEIWAKLDAGTEEYFCQVNRPNVSLDHIARNILETAKIRPVVIQSLWFRAHGTVPPVAEIEAYCERLTDLIAAGGKLKYVQLYTVARDPSERFVSRLSDAELDQIASTVRSRVPVSVEVFY